MVGVRRRSEDDDEPVDHDGWRRGRSKGTFSEPGAAARGYKRGRTRASDHLDEAGTELIGGVVEDVEI